MKTPNYLNNRFNFTEKALAGLPVPTNKRPVTYYDDGQPGLCIIVTYGGAKTYYSYIKFQGVPKRTKIGRVGTTKLVEARAKARELKTIADRGEDPGTEREEARKDMKLREFFDAQYYPRYSQVHKQPKSQVKDESMFRNYLAPFHGRKMISITQAEVERLHADLRDRISLFTANRAIGLLKHMYNKAIEWGYPRRHGNPAVGVKMFKELPRKRFLQPDELERFFDALNTEPNEIFKNYVLLSLFIGQRSSNMKTLRWSNVDLTLRSAYFPDSKNGEPQCIPLIDQAVEILAKMRQSATGDWVFPSNGGSKSGHIEDFHRPWYALLKRAKIKDFRFHDIRRTFGSYQAINGASSFVLGWALGDKTDAAVRVYAHLTDDPVRQSIQSAADMMLGYAGVCWGMLGKGENIIEVICYDNCG